MQGNFSYYNPTKLYFGEESLNFLKDELKNFGPVVLLNYGSGSVKRNGIYDQVVAILKEAGKPVSAGDVTKALNADRKEIDKIFAELKKEGAIVSPVRCKWEPAK